MMQTDLEKIRQRLEEILSPERGYFGRVSTWGQRPTEYEYIGYKLTTDFSSTMTNLSEEHRNNLVKVINYFEIHANPLRKLLDIKREEEQIYKFYSEIAWSHFMTVVMFGMLEVVVRIQQGVKLDKNGYLKDKGKEIKKFLEKNLSKGTKESIVRRYSTEGIFNKKEPTSFEEVVDHLWDEIRCGFVHHAGLESKGLEWQRFGGIGTKDNPITVNSDVPMQEWLQVTWQAILTSYGYKGLVELPKYDYKTKVLFK